jgi:hypothetical protein
MAMQKVMGKFGIIEIARTGRICLKRGEQLLEPGAGDCLGRFFVLAFLLSLSFFLSRFQLLEPGASDLLKIFGLLFFLFIICLKQGGQLLKPGGISLFFFFLRLPF